MSDSIFPKVSIVIPCYQAHEFIGDAVRCAVSQTYPNIEVVVAPDDGDDYEFLHRIFQSKSLKILPPLATTGTGPGATRNRAINVASGDFFVMLDADDLVPPNYIERLLSVARNEGAAIAPTLYVQWDGETIVRASVPNAPRLDLCGFGKLLCSMHPMIHRSLEPGFLDGFAEDVIRDGLVIAKLAGITVVKDTAYRLRIRPGSSCNSGEESERDIQRIYISRQKQILLSPTELGMQALSAAARIEFAQLFAFRAHVSRKYLESGEGCYNTWATGQEDTLWHAFRSGHALTPLEI